MTDLKDKAGIREIVEGYGPDCKELMRYAAWLESKSGAKTVSEYDPNDGNGGTMMFPVYDGTLLNFVKTADKLKHINRNYVYTYSRNRIRSEKDELELIDRAQITDMQLLFDILSSYILKGRTKGAVWSRGVENGVYLKLVTKMKDLIEFWTQPF